MKKLIVALLSSFIYTNTLLSTESNNTVTAIRNSSWLPRLLSKTFAGCIYEEEKVFPLKDKTLESKLKKLFTAEVSKAFQNRDKEQLRKYGFYCYQTKHHRIIAEHPSIPGWILKGPRHWLLDVGKNLERPFFAEKIRKTAEKLGYANLIEIPEKYHFCYHPGPLCNNNCLVIAKKLQLSSKSIIDLDKATLDKIIHLIESVENFWDVKIKKGDPNIVVTTENKIAFIDTEPVPMPYDIPLAITLFALWRYGDFLCEKGAAHKLKSEIMLTQMPLKEFAEYCAIIFQAEEAARKYIQWTNK